MFRHSIPECGDKITRCSMFAKYCDMTYMRVNGVPIAEICPYTCGQCPNLPAQPISTTSTVVMVNIFQESEDIKILLFR